MRDEEKCLVCGEAVTEAEIELAGCCKCTHCLLNPKDTTMAPDGHKAPTQPTLLPADKLEQLFDMQRALNNRIGVDPATMTEKDQVHWVLNYCRATTQELAELTDSVPWKWWAKYQTFDKQNARVEVVDLFHFLISLAQVLGMSAQDVFDLYRKKNEKNFQRQDSGYAVKDPNDCKEL